MRLPVTAVATMLLVCGIARADERTTNPVNADAKLGIGMICDTPVQAERYIALLRAGQKADLAMNVVNTEVKNPRACGIAAVVFTRDATLDTKTVHGKLLQVVRIDVIAGFNGVGWQRASSLVQYAVMEPTGMEI